MIHKMLYGIEITLLFDYVLYIGKPQDKLVCHLIYIGDKPNYKDYKVI